MHTIIIIQSIIFFVYYRYSELYNRPKHTIAVRSHFTVNTIISSHFRQTLYANKTD